MECYDNVGRGEINNHPRLPGDQRCGCFARRPRKSQRRVGDGGEKNKLTKFYEGQLGTGDTRSRQRKRQRREKRGPIEKDPRFSFRSLRDTERAAEISRLVV